MNLRNLLLIPVAIPVLWAFTAPEEELSFHIAEGTTLTSTFDTTVELSLDEMRIVTNGEEKDASMFGLEIKMSNATSLQFVDQFVHMDGAAPTEVIRTFKNLDNTVDTSQANAATGSMDTSVISESDLEGVAVRFRWDSEKSAYATSFADEDSDEDKALLEDLTARADMSGLLPPKSVSKGDTWEAKPDFILELMSPGGDLKQIPVDMEEGGRKGGDPMAELSFSEMMGDVEGTIRCEYMGSVEVEGVKYASIQVDLAVNSKNDLTAMLQKHAGEMLQESVDIQYDSVDVEMTIEGEGTLLWDQRGGHFVSFGFSGDLKQIMNMAIALATPNGNMDMDQTITMSGTLDLDFSAATE